MDCIQARFNPRGEEEEAFSVIDLSILREPYLEAFQFLMNCTLDDLFRQAREFVLNELFCVLMPKEEEVGESNESDEQNETQHQTAPAYLDLSDPHHPKLKTALEKTNARKITCRLGSYFSKSFSARR